MKFEKGQEKTGGRDKGVKNKKTIAWERLGEFITDAGANRVKAYLNSIEDDEEFFKVYERLLNYFKPRHQSTQLDANVKGEIQQIIGMQIIDDTKTKPTTETD